MVFPQLELLYFGHKDRSAFPALLRFDLQRSAKIKFRRLCNFIEMSQRAHREVKIKLDTVKTLLFET